MKPLLSLLTVVQLIVGSAALSAENSSSQSWFTKLSARVQSTAAEVSSVIPLDINRDGVDEVVFFEAKIGLHLYQHNGLDFIGKISLPHLVAHQLSCTDPNTNPEVIIALEDSTAVHLVSVVLSGNGDLSDYKAVFDTVFSEPRNTPEQISVGKPMITGIIDANGDGIRDYVAFRAYGLREKYRGVVLIDGKTKSELWHRNMGPLPQIIRICNLDGAGKPEIVVSSCTVGNGCVADGYADTASYLFAFTMEGRDFWHPIQIGGNYSRLEYRFIPDSNGRDTNLVVTTYNMKDSQAIQSIRIFSGRSGELMHEYLQPGGFRAARVCDLGADSARSIMAIAQSGAVFSFDSSLQVLQIRNFPESAVLMLPPIDCSGDSVREYPILTSDNMLWILDSQLAPMYSRQLGSQIAWLAPLADSKSNEREILCVADRPYTMTFYWGAKTFSEIVPPVVQIALVLSSLTALLVGYLQVRHRREYFEFLDAVFNDSSRAIVAVGVNRTFTRTNPMADELFDAKRQLLGRYIDALGEHQSLSPLLEIVTSFLASGSQRLETGAKLIIANKPREFAVSIYRSANARASHPQVTIIMLQDITILSQAKLYSAWSQVALGLVHDLRKPLATLKLLLQDLIARVSRRETTLESVGEEYLDPALAQVERMAKYIDQLSTAARSEAARRENICMNEFLLELIKELKSTNGCRAAISLTVEPNLPNVSVDRDNFERVILELIDNAAAATKHRQDPAVSIHVHSSTKSGNVVCLEVADNGCGIAPEMLPQVFEPYVTTGAGDHRGLGLWTARRVIIEHGGSIDIQSTKGIGTVFVIELPGVVKGE